MKGSEPNLVLSARLAFYYGGVFAVLGIYGPFWPVWLQAHGVGQPKSEFCSPPPLG